ncbi:MAG: hypothetical protein AAF250_03145 [Pseudomonadota bacterium]
MKIEIPRVFANTFGMAREQAAPLLGLWAVFLLIQIAAIGLVFLAVGGAAFAGASFDDPDPLRTLGLGVGAIIAIFALYFGYIFLYCVQSAAMAMSGSPLSRSGFGEALSGGFRSGVALFLAFLLLLVCYIIFSFALELLQQGLFFLGGLGEFLLSGGAFAGLVYFACRFAIITPVIAVDGERNPVSALRRSWALTDGNVLPIFIVLLVVGVATIVIGLVAVMLFGGLFFVSAASAPGMLTIVLALLTFVVFGGVAAVLGATLVSSLHAEVSSSEADDLSKTFE